MRHPIRMDKPSMNNVAFKVSHEEITENLRRAIGIVANENQIPKTQAREIIASEIQVAPGTLENIDRERVKGVHVRVSELIRNFLIRKLEHVIQETQAELAMARLSARHPASDEIIMAQTNLAEAVKEAEAFLKGEDLA